MKWITFLWCLFLGFTAAFLAAMWQHNIFAAVGFFAALTLARVLIERECR